MSLATAESIRDRHRLLIEYVDPVLLTSTRFRRWRAENGLRFRDVMEKKPELRRFHSRVVDSDPVPLVSNMDFAEYTLTIETVIAYPQTNRSGPDGALDREDVIDSDWREIDYNIGITGRANFYDTHDCTPLGCTHEIEEGAGVDFLVIRAQYQYKRALSQNGGFASGFGSGFGG